MNSFKDIACQVLKETENQIISQMGRTSGTHQRN